MKIGGVKLSLDGSMPGKTAYTSKPYIMPPHGSDPDYKGYPAWTQNEVDKFIKLAWDRKLQILAHCNADGAGDQLLNAIKKLDQSQNIDWRPVMIHAQMAREDQLDDMKKLQIIPSFEMTHPYLFGDYYINSVMGDQLGQRNNPAGSAMKRSMPYTFHTDAPVVIPDLLMTAWTGVNRLTRPGKVIGEEQRVTPYEAMKALTSYAAYQNFEEDLKGSLKIGKLADLVILSDNPLAIQPEKIKNIKVLETIKEGYTVFKRN